MIDPMTPREPTPDPGDLRGWLRLVAKSIDRSCTGDEIEEFVNSGMTRINAYADRFAEQRVAPWKRDLSDVTECLTRERHSFWKKMAAAQMVIDAVRELVEAEGYIPAEQCAPDYLPGPGNRLASALAACDAERGEASHDKHANAIIEAALALHRAHDDWAENGGPEPESFKEALVNLFVQAAAYDAERGDPA
jgi:hypothetical protein